MRILENVCRKGIGRNSITCVEHFSWVHKRSIGISGKLKSIVDVHCRKCLEGSSPVQISRTLAERG